MKRIDQEAYQRLRAGGTMIERDLHGEKVVRLPDGTLLKLFRRKHLLSSALLYPYAQRFADNCRKLAELAIPCPVVRDVFRVPAIARDVVHYQPLPGQTVRQLRDQLSPAEAEAMRRELGAFVAGLHWRGIYFRSLHLGNIVRTPEGLLGLIDIADLALKRGPLGVAAQRRNMRHLARYRDDHAWLTDDGNFARAYAAAQAK